MNWLTVLQGLYYIVVLGGMGFAVHGTWVTRNNHLKHLTADVEKLQKTVEDGFKTVLKEQEELSVRVAKQEGFCKATHNIK